MLRYFAAVMPPAPIAQQIVEAMSRNATGDHTVTTNPNLKVIYRDGIEPYPEWETVVSNVAADTKPFELKLGKPEFIGEYLLALPIESPEILDIHAKSVERMHAMEKKEGQTPDQVGVFFESQSVYIPHVSLATGIFKSNKERNNLLKSVTKELANLPSFTVSELTLYEALVFDATYEAKATIPLGKPGSSFVRGLDLNIVRI